MISCDHGSSPLFANIITPRLLQNNTFWSEVEPPSASSTEKPGRRPVSSRPIRTPWDWDWISWWCFILSYTLLGRIYSSFGLLVLFRYLFAILTAWPNAPGEDLGIPWRSWQGSESVDSDVSENLKSKCLVIKHDWKINLPFYRWFSSSPGPHNRHADVEKLLFPIVYIYI